MVEKEFEQDDPFELVGTVLPSSDISYIEAMAETFIEEYLRMGWTDDMILKLFKTPFYQGPYIAYEVLGEDRVKTMISQVMAGLKLGGR